MLFLRYRPAFTVFRKIGRTGGGFQTFFFVDCDRMLNFGRGIS
jgi:hypothetical protein